MENASKALIIAGAVLISILLISLGIIMFNSSKGTSDQAGEAAAQMQAGAEGGVANISGQLDQYKKKNPGE